MKRLQ